LITTPRTKVPVVPPGVSTELCAESPDPFPESLPEYTLAQSSWSVRVGTLLGFGGASELSSGQIGRRSRLGLSAGSLVPLPIVFLARDVVENELFLTTPSALLAFSSMTWLRTRVLDGRDGGASL